MIPVVARLDRAIQYAEISRLTSGASGIPDHPLSRMTTTVVAARSCHLFSVPAARPQPLVHVLRRGGHHVHGLLIPGDRNPDFAGMQMQLRLAEARAVAVDVVA